MEKEIMQAIQEDRLYDFIANHYWEMSRETSRDLLLELIYMIYFDYEYCIEENRKTLNEHIIESLKDNRAWEE